MRENTEARAKCMKNRLHLGQFVTQRYVLYIRTYTVCTFTVYTVHRCIGVSYKTLFIATQL